MLKRIRLVVALSVMSLASNNLKAQVHPDYFNPTPSSYQVENRLLFQEIGLEGVLNYTVFETALKGYQKLNNIFDNKNIISIVDFTLPSSEKRFYVIDLQNKQLLFHSVVAHGENSGDLYATNFSNRVSSHQSSLGFYVTEKTYQGKNGYSLVINGLEEGINDKAKERYVVIHGAHYCHESVIEKTGKLGTSQGCPALPHSINRDVINVIKDGSMLFIYADNEDYKANSKVISSTEKEITTSSSS